MTSKRPQSPDRSQPDFTKLPEPVELSDVVETHDVDPETHRPESKFASPEIEDMSRTGAIGFGF